MKKMLTHLSSKMVGTNGMDVLGEQQKFVVDIM